MRTRAERWSEGRVGGGAKDVPLFLVTLVDDGPAPTFPRVRRAWLASRRVLGGWTEGPAARHTCQSGLVGIDGRAIGWVGTE